MTVTFTPVTASLGAVVEGVDPRDPGLDMDAIHQALLDHEVICFRGSRDARGASHPPPRDRQ
jgi:alpha-ketoglutarate-dependent taurine dioxygenase